ncbi:hypothetical protein GUJ93_ZPchr0014g47644 [Zizania palustris]|uniref:Uncharacterized protein n=1 Tax=Zizania palustris TaxID=103762 RepID=A0A8J5VRX4_ZIZPA|nr:hypothetical protein GUJ93_ZPchr0014g47644 [Zizania palustris]
MAQDQTYRVRATDVAAFAFARRAYVPFAWRLGGRAARVEASGVGGEGGAPRRAVMGEEDAGTLGSRRGWAGAGDRWWAVGAAPRRPIGTRDDVG